MRTLEGAIFALGALQVTLLKWSECRSEEGWTEEEIYRAIRDVEPSLRMLTHRTAEGISATLPAQAKVVEAPIVALEAKAKAEPGPARLRLVGEP